MGTKKKTSLGGRLIKVLAMGAAAAKLRALASRKKTTRLLMIGLDNAGKSTILYKLKLGEVVQSIPTIGFNVETVEYKSLKFMVWDIGGQDRIRNLWRHYYNGTQGLIFVVDSSDRDRIDEARDELHKALNEVELEKVKVRSSCVVFIFMFIQVLVLANKQDLPQAMPAAEVSERLQLKDIKDKPWYIQSCSAISGDGLSEGLDW